MNEISLYKSLIMADYVVRNDPLDFDNQAFEAWLEDWFVQQAVWDTKTRTLKSLLLWWTAVGRVLDILWLREQDPSEMVEQLEKYRVEALNTLNTLNDNDASNNKVEEKIAA